MLYYDHTGRYVCIQGDYEGDDTSLDFCPGIAPPTYLSYAICSRNAFRIYRKPWLKWYQTASYSYRATFWYFNFENYSNFVFDLSYIATHLHNLYHLHMFRFLNVAKIFAITCSVLLFFILILKASQLSLVMQLYMGNVWVWVLAEIINWNGPSVTFRSVFQNSVT